MSDIMRQWQQVAIALGDSIYRSVNSPDMVGTDDETGYVLMFFNVKKHGGKSTLVSTATNKSDLKKLLKSALDELDGPKPTIVERDRYAH